MKLFRLLVACLDLGLAVFYELSAFQHPSTRVLDVVASVLWFVAAAVWFSLALKD